MSPLRPTAPSARLRTLKHDFQKVLRASEKQSLRTPLQLLVISSYLNRLHFIDQINNRVTWDEKQWKFSPGVLSQLLVLLPFIFANRKIPLSRIHEAYTGMDLELLVGEPIDPSDLNDDLFARVLDRIFESGCSDLFSAIALSVRLTFELPEDYLLHSDTTSHVLYGDYPEREDYTPPLTITNGYSKQKRDDLKQIMTGMVTDGAGLIIYCKPLDGNTADCTYNHDVLSSLKQIFGSDFKKYTYVADSKLLTKPNFDRLTEGEAIRFISRIPENFYKKLAEKIRIHAYAENNWTWLGTCCKYPDSDKSTQYWVVTVPVNVYGHPCYIHLYRSSDGEKKVNRNVEKAESELKNELSTLLKKQFACEPDAVAELQRFCKEHCCGLVVADLTVIREDEIKRPRGRPSKNSKPPEIVSTWRIRCDEIQRNDSKIEEKRQKLSTFALLTNIDPDDKSDRDILLDYKGQSKVEQNFSLLKEPLIAATIFLEKPERIMALMTMLYFSVLMHGILRVIAHLELEKFKTPPRISSNNRPLVRPSSDTMIWLLSFFTIISKDESFEFESKMMERTDQIELLFQLTRFDPQFIGAV